MKKYRRRLTFGLSKLTSFFITLLVFIGLFLLFLESQLPDVDALKDIQLPVPLRIYTSDAQLIAEFGEIQREPLTLSGVPPLLIQAILATEDQRFFQHSGIDVPGLTRAVVELLMTGTKSQGGSTITMQVARNFYLSREKTFIRKLNEILLAVKIEHVLSKEKILELYLNKIYLGKHAYGVAAAAHIYYGKKINQLTLPEFAMIAGLPKAPSKLNPIANPLAAKKRRDHVLRRMYEVGNINEKTYKEAIATPLSVNYHGRSVAVRAPYVAEMVRNLMATSFGVDAYTKGYQVFTTVDSKLQHAASLSLRNALIAYDERHGYRTPNENLGSYQPSKSEDWEAELEAIPSINGLKPAAVVSVTGNEIKALLATGQTVEIKPAGFAWIKSRPQQVLRQGDIIRLEHYVSGGWKLSQLPQVQGALVALNPQSGAILALEGGFDYRKSSFNRVTQAQRQPGSSFKPFIYAAALDKGFTLASVLNDAPLVFANVANQTLWRPQNDSHRFEGPTRLRVALAKSINLISIRLLQAIGLPYTLDYLHHFGFDTGKFPQDLSLALGTGTVTPLELTTGYAVIANGGYKVEPYLIDHITTLEGKLVYESHPKIVCSNCLTPANIKNSTPSKIEYAPQILSPQITFLVTSAMQEVIRSGTGSAAKVLGRDDLAGKTGTTSDFVDTWFSGFNGDIVTTTWVGFDQPTPLHEHGAQAALPMWIEFMRSALTGKPSHTMEQPPEIVTARIDPNTGLLARAEQGDGLFELFKADTLPNEIAPPHIDQSMEMIDVSGAEEPLY